MDSIIAGLLPYPPNILVLSYTSISPPSTPSSSEVDFRRRTATRPELRIVSPDKEELSSDALSLKGYERLQPGDYSLAWNEKLKCVYIISPNDIVVGMERTPEDRVQWLLDRGKYREALEVFENNTSSHNQSVGKWNRKEIGVNYIEHLIEEGNNSMQAQVDMQDNGRKLLIVCQQYSIMTQLSGRKISSSSQKKDISRFIQEPHLTHVCRK
jgi:vacuolar protein sorting-associated protein 41